VKKLKNSIPLLLILALFTSTITLLSPVAAQFYTILYLDPSITTDGPPSPATFDLSVKVRWAFDLYGFEFKLKYDPSVLTATDIYIGEWFFTKVMDLGYGEPQEWNRDINNIVGCVWYAVSMPLGCPEGIDITGDLAIISFNVVGDAATVLDLDDTILGNVPDPGVPGGGERIEHLALDGYFSNVGLVPVASIKVSESTPEEKEKITLDGDTSMSYDPINDPIVSYAWDFGDGSTGTGAIVEHSYGHDGTYTVTLTVTTELLKSDIASATIVVTNPTANLVKRGVWPEHRNYNATADENSIEDWEDPWIVRKFQTLSAMVKNLAPTPTDVKVVFNIYYADTMTAYKLGIKTYQETLDPGAETIITYDMWPPPIGMYYVTARALYWDNVVNNWVPGARVRSCGFTVVESFTGV